MTEEMINQIQQDEDLAKYFSNPSFMDAVGLFQRNPQEAMAKYGNNKEIMQFFDRMVKLMGKSRSTRVSLLCVLIQVNSTAHRTPRVKRKLLRLSTPMLK